MKALILILLIALVSSESNLRNLGFIYNCEKTYVIKSITALGSTVTFKERVGVKNGKAFCQLIISSNLGTQTFGISGASSAISKTYSVTANLMKFNFPSSPTLQILLKASGSLSCSIKVSSGKLILTLSGSLYAKGDITDGFSQFASVSLSPKGTIITFNHSFTIDSSNQISRSGKASGGAVSILIEGKLLDKNVFKKTQTLWSGWSA